MPFMKKQKRGTPWAAINARKAKLVEERAHKEARNRIVAADAARGGAAAEAPMAPGQELSPHWNQGPPAKGTRAVRKVLVFATSSATLYGVGVDEGSAQEDMMEHHERRTAEAAAATLQKLSQDDTYARPSSDISAAMERQKKRQGGFFKPLSFLPPLEETVDEESSDESFSTTEPRPSPNPGRFGIYAPLPSPSQGSLPPSGNEKGAYVPPATKYYTNPHHGPSRYRGWYEHNYKPTSASTSGASTPRAGMSYPSSISAPSVGTPLPSIPSASHLAIPYANGIFPPRTGRPLIPPSIPVFTNGRNPDGPFRPDSTSEPLLGKDSQAAGADQDEDDGSEWCAPHVPEVRDAHDTDHEKRFAPDGDVVRPEPQLFHISGESSNFTTESSSKKRNDAHGVTDQNAQHSSANHRSSVFIYSQDSFITDILYARELFGDSFPDDAI